MDSGKEYFEYGNQRIDYELLFVDRKTMEIAVHPDSRVVVKAPVKASLDKVKSKVSKRARWIHKQLDYFSRFEPRTPPKAYISGETHLYLGRQYRLKVKKGTKDSVKLTRGMFWLTSKIGNDPVVVNRLLNEWYRVKATEVFNKCLDDCMRKLKKHDFKQPELIISCMKRRWGSLSRSGTLSLNIDLVKAPRDCIEYVVTHELCHQKFHHHGPEYYRLLEKVMPDWSARKHRLEIRIA